MISLHCLRPANLVPRLATQFRYDTAHVIGASDHVGFVFCVALIRENPFCFILH